MRYKMIAFLCVLVGIILFYSSSKRSEPHKGSAKRVLDSKPQEIKPEIADHKTQKGLVEAPRVSKIEKRLQTTDFCDSSTHSDSFNETILIMLEALNLNSCMDLYKTLQTRESLNLVGLEIFDLGPLAYFRQLRSLDLSGNQIENLEPLSGLTLLESLKLAKNKFTYLGPLKKLVALKHLDVSSNQIVSLASLAKLIALKDLEFDNNYINNLMPLKELPRLEHLSPWENPVENDRDFENCPITSVASEAVKTFCKALKNDRPRLITSKSKQKRRKKPQIEVFPEGAIELWPFSEAARNIVIQQLGSWIAEVESSEIESDKLDDVIEIASMFRRFIKKEKASKYDYYFLVAVTIQGIQGLALIADSEHFEYSKYLEFIVVNPSNLGLSDAKIIYKYVGSSILEKILSMTNRIVLKSGSDTSDEFYLRMGFKQLDKNISFEEDGYAILKGRASKRLRQQLKSKRR